MEINSPLKLENELRPIILLVLTLLGCVLGGCEGGYITFSTPYFPPAPCPIQKLLIDVNTFPGSDWEETGSRSERAAPERMGIERIGTSFSMTNGGVVQEVYRFEDKRGARRAYKDKNAPWFTPSDYETEWAMPHGMGNFAVNAEQYRVGCNDHKSGGFEQCQYVAQYGSYVIRFFAHMRTLTYKDFINLVKEIDHRATGCLERKPGS